MHRRPVLAILGGSLSGNKGAASMLLAVADGLRDQVPDTQIKAFSPYPVEDRQRPFDGEIIDFKPRDMLLRVLPRAILSLATMRRWLPTKGVAGELASADVVADVSGISFMDGRGGPILVYNTLLALLPWAFGVPVVKMAQALGPFDKTLNRVTARFVLRRVTWIGLRGPQTGQHVERLNLVNAHPAADVAFLLRTNTAAEARADALLPGDSRITIVAPSAVVEQQCREYDIDYVARLSHVIGGLGAQGHEVVLIAHSARVDAGGDRTNDLPVCRRIAETSSARLIDYELDARELRALIGRARLLVTSRFHAMISGLATMTPTFVVGWSHKYVEVLSEFGLDDWAVDFRDATDDDLLERILGLDEAAEDVRSIIQNRLPSVLLQAKRNLVPLIEIVSGSQ